MVNRIINSDCIEGMKQLPDNSVDCCVTSPPYFGLRDYGHDGQIGLEETPEQFVDKMVEVFEQVKRVLKPEGTLWLNLGDSYAANIRQYGSKNAGELTNNSKGVLTDFRKKRPAGYKEKDLYGIPWMVAFALRQPFFTCHGCGNKTHSLKWGKFPNGRMICPICELSKGHDTHAGWYLRQDIIWHKPNPMPESVTDRCTKSHEYIFLLSKSAKYYYDHEAVKLPLTDATLKRMGQDIENQKGSTRVPGKTNGTMKAVIHGIGKGEKAQAIRGDGGTDEWQNSDGKANKRSVWTVTTKPFTEAHFATFPEDLIVDCIKAGCPEYVCANCGKAREKIIKSTRLRRNELPKDDPRYRPNQYNGAYGDINGKGDAGYTQTEVTGLTDCGCGEGFVPGTVLDPFMGAGTTALVARKLNRNYIGFELNAEYIKIGEKRLRNELGMFL